MSEKAPIVAPHIMDALVRSEIHVKFWRGSTHVEIKRAGKIDSEHFDGTFLSECIDQMSTDQREWFFAMIKVIG